MSRCFDRASWPLAHQPRSVSSCSPLAFAFALTGAPEPFAAILRSAGVRDVQAHDTELSVAGGSLTTPQIVRALVEAGAEIEAVEREEPSLEEVYIRLLHPGDASA